MTTQPHDTYWDVIVLGAGGAGLMCAAEAAYRGRRVLAVDHSARLGGKILISGGGRCNFTNVGASPSNYVSENPHFSRSALSRFTPQDFIELVRARDIAFHEKKLGQLFCDGSAQAIVDLLRARCEDAGVSVALETTLPRGAAGIRRLDSKQTEGARSSNDARFEVETSRGTLTCTSLVVATGGLSLPKLGATGLGYEIAKAFHLPLVQTLPALDGFVLAGQDQARFGGLSGLSVDTIIDTPQTRKSGHSFRENILFTHSGLSGPAALQASLHWNAGDPVYINFLPERPDFFDECLAEKKAGSRVLLKTLLSTALPARLADRLCEVAFSESLQTPLPQISEKRLKEFVAWISAQGAPTLTPIGTVGYSKAEVTRGGVSTEALSSKTLEARTVPGLYFVGEVVDVTGWLGGYNFQWAWASGWAAGQVV